MAQRRDCDWFSLTRQPQEPVSSSGPTLDGEALATWKGRFRPLLRFLKRKRVVLALSGGGMAMSCHVSVLRVLEILGVRLDAVYGTSAGAVVGGLYAAGVSVGDLERIMLEIEHPDDLFGFGARHPAVRLAAGEVVRAFTEPSFERSGIYDGAHLEGYVTKLMERYIGAVPTLSQLRVPFSCVAFDIGTGHPDPEKRERATKRVFSARRTPDVSLADAIGASMAVPGTFPPKRIGDRFHIDGATVEELPVATAYDDWISHRRMGRPRTVVIASDLGYGGNAPRERTLARPMDLVLYASSVQGRAMTDYSLLYCHRPRRGFSVILVRPRTLSVALYETEKIPGALKTAYEATVEQLSGSGFLELTREHVRCAGSFLGLSDLGDTRSRRRGSR